MHYWRKSALGIWFAIGLPKYNRDSNHIHRASINLVGEKRWDVCGTWLLHQFCHVYFEKSFDDLECAKAWIDAYIAEHPRLNYAALRDYERNHQRIGTIQFYGDDDRFHINVDLSDGDHLLYLYKRDTSVCYGTVPMRSISDAMLELALNDDLEPLTEWHKERDEKLDAAYAAAEPKKEQGA